tara:strand:+ start:1138 stop:1311 length:174 start_codon:yes stop_codon:yes gene_type:complete
MEEPTSLKDVTLQSAIHVSRETLASLFSYAKLTEERIQHILGGLTAEKSVKTDSCHS